VKQGAVPKLFTYSQKEERKKEAKKERRKIATTTKILID
jgi:hypothetical protein